MPGFFPQRLSLCLILALLLGACQATLERPYSEQTRIVRESLPSSCSDGIRLFREDVKRNDALDASTPALGFFPLLHSNRFLHTLALWVQSQEELSEWTTLLAELAIEVRAAENRNLNSPWSEEALGDLAECSRIFSSSAEFREERRAILDTMSRADFPDEYSRGLQTLGALPLLRPFLKPRILAEHAKERSMYFEEETFTHSSLYRLEREQSVEVDVAEWMRTAYGNNALQLPLLRKTQLDALFDKHAPGLQIELLDVNDKIGEPRWQAGQVIIDTENPVVYSLPSMTRFEGRNLLQLNYVFWFPERKPVALIDLYAGKVDSIIWRVTLDEGGRVMFYDSIHSCGCYHKYFAVADELKVKAQPTSREPANIFYLDRMLLSGGLDLKITGNEHFIVGIEPSMEQTEASAEVQRHGYQLTPYTLLKNLDTASGSRSLFDARGLIPGSERLERFTLWPTGIPSVGAMRQWGTHATGFIQEQQFDDSNLFENYFETQP